LKKGSALTSKKTIVSTKTITASDNIVGPFSFTNLVIRNVYLKPGATTGDNSGALTRPVNDLVASFELVGDTMKRMGKVTATVKLKDTKDRFVYVVFQNPGGGRQYELCREQTQGKNEISCTGMVPIQSRAGGNPITLQFYVFRSMTLTGTSRDYVSQDSGQTSYRIIRTPTAGSEKDFSYGDEESSISLAVLSNDPKPGNILGMDFGQDELARHFYSATDLTYASDGQRVPWPKYGSSSPVASAGGVSPSNTGPVYESG